MENVFLFVGDPATVPSWLGRLDRLEAARWAVVDKHPDRSEVLWCLRGEAEEFAAAIADLLPAHDPAGPGLNVEVLRRRAEGFARGVDHAIGWPASQPVGISRPAAFHQPRGSRARRRA